MLSSLGNRIRSFIQPEKEKDSQDSRGGSRKRPASSLLEVEADLIETPENKRQKISEGVFQALGVPFSKVAEWIVKQKDSFLDRYHTNPEPRARARNNEYLSDGQFSHYRPSDPVGRSMGMRVSRSNNEGQRSEPEEWHPPPPPNADIRKLNLFRSYPVPPSSSSAASSAGMKPDRSSGRSEEGQPRGYREGGRGDRPPGSKPGSTGRGVAPPRSSTRIPSATQTPQQQQKQFIPPSYRSVFEKTFEATPQQNGGSFHMSNGQSFHRTSSGQSSRLAPKVYTAKQSINMEEKERYRQLLQQFTTTPILPGTFSVTARQRPLPLAMMASNSTLTNTTLLGSDIPKAPKAFQQEVLVPTTRQRISPSDMTLSQKRPELKESTEKVPNDLDASIITHLPPKTKSSDTGVSLVNTSTESPPIGHRKKLGRHQPVIVDLDAEPDIVEILDEKPPSKSPPAFQDVLQSSPYWTDEWINSLKERFESETLARKRQIEEEKIKSSYFEEKRKEQEAALEEQIRQRMVLTETIPPVVEEAYIEEEEEEEEEKEEEEEFPELTVEQEDMVDNALVPFPEGQILVEAFGLRIARRDMSTLLGLNWLNDEVINFYMNLLIERGKQKDCSKVHAFNTFFYPKLMSGGHAALKRWTRKVDVFAVDYIVVPVHLGMHWCLALVDFKEKAIKYFDSMGGKNTGCLKALRQYLLDESLDKKKRPFDMTGWRDEIVKDIPQQMNGSDCGVFACKYAEYATRGAKITFTQEHMPYFRRAMTYEILTKQLLCQ